MDGNTLRARRQALGLTQAELAAAIGYNANTVARWERGELAIGKPLMVEAVIANLEREARTVAQDRRQREAEAWGGYVGSQSPQEFWEISQSQGHTTVESAVNAYAHDLPNVFDDWDGSQDLDEIAELLVSYIRQSLDA